MAPRHSVMSPAMMIPLSSTRSSRSARLDDTAGDAPARRRPSGRAPFKIVETPPLPFCVIAFSSLRSLSAGRSL